MEDTLKIEHIDVQKLKPAVYNPRKISDEQVRDLRESLSKFGCIDPLVVNKDFTVVGGHQRLRVWQELENKTIPCVFVDVNKKDERELNFRLNGNGGTFDREKLNELFSVDEMLSIGAGDFVMELKGEDFGKKEAGNIAGYGKFTINFNEKSEYDFFNEFLVLLVERFPKADNLSKRICNYVAMVLEENGNDTLHKEEAFKKFYKAVVKTK